VHTSTTRWRTIEAELARPSAGLLTDGHQQRKRDAPARGTHLRRAYDGRAGRPCGRAAEYTVHHTRAHARAYACARPRAHLQSSAVEGMLVGVTFRLPKLSPLIVTVTPELGGMFTLSDCETTGAAPPPFHRRRLDRTGRTAVNFERARARVCASAHAAQQSLEARLGWGCLGGGACHQT
jgi:hypothetical protein